MNFNDGADSLAVFLLRLTIIQGDTTLVVIKLKYKETRFLLN